MKYGIFSDVHSNMEAFQAVLDALKREGVDKYVFLGDLVGYAADPRECIRMLRDLKAESGCICVGGNHDYAVCGLTDYKKYDPYAVEAIKWTKGILDKPDIKFLSEMKLVEKTDDITLVHSSLYAPEEWWYILDIDDAYPCFKLLETNVCFYGHSHKPVFFISGEMVDWIVDDQMVIDDDKKYIINVGSVGQPRDRNPESAFAVYDTEERIVRIKRVAYDISKTQERIISAGLPHMLAQRLRLGK
jgi:predicted phosphodiesterase